MVQNNNSMNKTTVFKRLLILIGVFTSAMAMWFLGTGCLVKKVTGIICPSCGMTRAFFAFINGNFAESFKLHPMLLSIPILALMFMFYDKLFTGKLKIPSIVLFSLIIIGFIINYIYQLSLFF